MFYIKYYVPVCIILVHVLVYYTENNAIRYYYISLSAIDRDIRYHSYMWMKKQVRTEMLSLAACSMLDLCDKFLQRKLL